MKILYLSCHATLEADETKLFTEMGHEVFSFGAYINPSSPGDTKRPGYDGQYHEHLASVAIQSSKENLHQELVDWADVIIVMHRPDWIEKNWDKIKHKKVVWRTIGQSVPNVEKQLLYFRNQGMKIVRYSPYEDRIQGYIGEDAMIRFYKDPEEYKDWNGTIRQVINVTQSMKQRGNNCGYEIFEKVVSQLPNALYGPQSLNSDGSGMVDPLWKGQLSYEELLAAYRDNRVYFYTGTYPASYTLNFIEAFMTGIPIVGIGAELANLNVYQMDSYEVNRIIENGVTGFTANSVPELREKVNYLLDNLDECKRISVNARAKAIELFGKETIKAQWQTFLESL